MRKTSSPFITKSGQEPREYFITEEGERVTALDGLQPWHAYAVIARKP
jgi:hypothetical protein